LQPISKGAAANGNNNVSAARNATEQEKARAVAKIIH